MQFIVMADFKCFSCSVPKVHSEYCQASMTAQKMKFSVKDFISKCDQIRCFQRIWSHLLKKSLMENFSFCAVHDRVFCEISWQLKVVDYFGKKSSTIDNWQGSKNPSWSTKLKKHLRRSVFC